MYEIREEIMNNLKDEFEEELAKRGYDYTSYAVDTIFKEWFAKKQMLLELLSKHPNWAPERLMIRFDEDYSRQIDIDVAMDFYYWLKDNTEIDDILVVDGDYSWERYWLSYIVRNLFFDATYISDEDQSYIDMLNGFNSNWRIRPGMKVTKVLGKICRTYGWDKITKTEINHNGDTITYNAFEREYAKYCDAMSPIKVTRHTCISLNPLDYLLMSHGNSWRSCHYIGHVKDYVGEYSSGTVSYMLDEHSIIFYTIDASYDGEEIELEPKLQRQVFGYNDFQLMQSRLYPQSNDHGAMDIYTDIRNTMQKVIADCLNVPNMWIKRKVQNVRRGDNATCYPDWNSFGACSTSVLREKKEVDLKAIVLGAGPICVECGSRHRRSGNINCCQGTVECTGCGCRIEEDDVYYVGDDQYCSDCVTWCECCDSYVPRENATHIPSMYGYVCDECLNEYYTYCDDCNTWHRNSYVTYIDRYDIYVCEDCLKDNYTKCSECGDYVYDEDITTVFDKDTGETHFYCDDCTPKK